jgi:hypothetical protein
MPELCGRRGAPQSLRALWRARSQSPELSLMGEARSCDARCHKAKYERCTCWCGGLFHGRKGEAAREAFAEQFQQLPETVDDFGKVTAQQNLFATDAGERWRVALKAARAARAAAAEKGEKVKGCQS